MSLYNRVIEQIESNRFKAANGGINCIPLPFRRFSSEFPGIEQKNYYHVTASTKIGKTQITDALFLYHPVLYAMNNPDKLKIKVFYFTLEMSKEQKEIQLMSHLLWGLSRGEIRRDPKALRSLSKPLEEEVVNMLKSEQYGHYFEFFENHVEFIDSIRHPYGIYKFIKDYADAHGIMHKRIINIVNNQTGEVTPHEVDDYYEPNDPDEYVIIIVDHMALLTAEKGGNLRDAMIKLSEYFVQIRNKYRYIPVAVIQQSAAQESIENMKYSRLKPSLDGYGDAKTISRDADMILGLFSPYRHGIREYEKYNIEQFRDNIRFLEIIAGREGGGGNVCPLFFDGGVTAFNELPLPDKTREIEEVYRIIEKIRRDG